MTDLHHFHSLPKVDPGYVYKYPRTMTEAFPDHNKRDLYTPYTPMHRSDKIAVAGSVIALVVLCALLLTGVLA